MAHNPEKPMRGADLETQAADWIARQDRGLTPREQDDYFHWLAADARHGEWIARHTKTLKGLKSLAQWRPEHGVRPNPDLLRASPVSSRRVWPAFLLAAAAAVAAFFVVRVHRANLAQGTVVAAPTPVHEETLEDGSVIALNRNAAVSVRYTATERRVTLVHGEAHFTVAKNRARPFIVTAGTIQFRAVGTAFDVRLTGEAVELLVTEGRVAVAKALPASDAFAGGPASPVLGAGERTSVVLAAAAPVVTAIAVSPDEIARTLAWRPRELEFSDTPLSQVVAEFNRANQIKLVVDDPELGLMPIGATLRSDNVEGFVRLLEASFRVKAERRPDGVIVLRRAPTADGAR